MHTGNLFQFKPVSSHQLLMVRAVRHSLIGLRVTRARWIPPRGLRWRSPRAILETTDSTSEIFSRPAALALHLYGTAGREMDGKRMVNW